MRQFAPRSISEGIRNDRIHLSSKLPMQGLNNGKMGKRDICYPRLTFPPYTKKLKVLWSTKQEIQWEHQECQNFWTTFFWAEDVLVRNDWRRHWQTESLQADWISCFHNHMDSRTRDEPRMISETIKAMSRTSWPSIPFEPQKSEETVKVEKRAIHELPLGLPMITAPRPWQFNLVYCANLVSHLEDYL